MTLQQKRSHLVGRTLGATALMTAAIAIGGCGSSGATATLTPDPTQVVTPAPEPSATSAATPAPSGPLTMRLLHGDDTDPIAAGTYVTPPVDGFFPGLQLTIPDGWLAEETDWGELKLLPAGRLEEPLLLWKDLVPTITNNRDGKVGQPIHGADASADALLTWLTTTSDFEILEGPTNVTIGDGIEGTQLTLTSSGTANFDDPDCPGNPRCVAMFTDLHHWPSGEFYAIGGDEVARIFIATTHFADGDHTFFVTLDAVNQDHLATLAEEAQPIIDSLQLPETYVNN